MPDPAHPLSLPMLMTELELEGWQFKLTSRVVDGARRYSAIAWKEDELVGGSKCRHINPAEALRLARADAQRQRSHRKKRKEKEIQ